MSDPGDYEKQRRNTYGEAPHAARKAIPRRKRLQNKKQRRAVKSALAVSDAETPRQVGKEASVRHVFRKQPDQPLGRVLLGRLVRQFVSGKLGEATFRTRLEALRARYPGFAADYRQTIAGLSHVPLAPETTAVLAEYR